MRAAPAFSVLLLLAACGHQVKGPVTEPPVAPATEHTMPMAHEPAAPDDRMVREGQRLFDEVCSQCHTVDPPPNLAPPMRMVAMQLRKAFDTRDAAVDHVVSYAPAPDAEQSILPSHAVERFGLMPPQPLRPDQLEKVATYVWSLGEGSGTMGGMEGMGGMGGRHGRGPMGMRRQGGMQHADSAGMPMRMRRRGGGGS